MLGLLLNMANVHAQSEVLFVENTRGLIHSAIVAREAKYGLRVEFCEGSLKCNNEITHFADLPASMNLRVGTVSANLLI